MDYSEHEYRLAREVLYLHSLWHRGPPPTRFQTPTSNPNFSSPHLPYHDPTFYLRPSSFSNPNPYSFPNPSHYYYNYNYNYNYPNSSRLTPEGSNKKQKVESPRETEWPCDPPSVPGDSSPDKWAPFEQSVPLATISPGTDARAALISMQLPAVQSSKDFFSQHSDSESECESESESESESENDDVDGFFRALFANDVGLRVCYEKDHENGEFYCLVCEGRRDGHKGKGKVYRGCTALVQHASAVCKVGQLVAHRAFARAVCQVLGWDPERLPSIVPLPGCVVKVDHPEDKRETDANLNSNSTFDNLENEGHTDPTTFLDMDPPATSAAMLAVASLPPPIPSQSDDHDRSDDIQCRAVRATKNFFSAIKEDYRCISDNEPGSKSESKFEVKPDMDEFFDGMFGKDSELKEYYRNNSEKGDFFCCVCEAKDDSKGKGMLYKSGLALVQHANTISKAGCSEAHEALAKAVCRVLEWDATNVPYIAICSPPQVALETGASGIEDMSNREDSNKEDNSGSNVKKDCKGVV
ncbi:hypothetical protein LUZ63_004259 [Rhynchospora breviuscula]|uniref:Uncharacterized protein n=1 Tax=Rhynchospora breviuscula TaxID=2022672 RepID=A0A9Q0D324_9POAL|nr:hypothetical protein LUZ63_004259 [Rhynchospora breviuscula]